MVQRLSDRRKCMVEGDTACAARSCQRGSCELRLVRMDVVRELRRCGGMRSRRTAVRLERSCDGVGSGSCAATGSIVAGGRASATIILLMGRLLHFCALERSIWAY